MEKLTELRGFIDDGFEVGVDLAGFDDFFGVVQLEEDVAEDVLVSKRAG